MPEDRKEWDALALAGRENGRPPEPPIYFGKWLTLDSAPDLPLLISPGYRQGGKRIRQVLTVGSELVVIDDEEVDTWIDKAMAAGER